MSRSEKARKVRVQLAKLASAGTSLSVNELRIVLALERIVARLVQDKILEKHLVYKGGFVLMKTLGSDRFTRDLDALGVGIDKDDVARLVPLALEVDLGDGFWFGDIRVKPLNDQGDYGALRFDSAYQLGEPEPGKTAKLSRIHFDVGFGDRIPSRIKPTNSESMLPNEKPISWKVYPPEFIFSEKLQTLIKRANANSRAKDVYDLVLLFEKCEDRAAVNEAVRATFTARETEIPKSFFEFANNLDLRQIEISWKSVQLEASDVEFSTVWRRLLSALKEFDARFS